MDERMEADTRARNRFIVLNVVRLTGVAMVLVAIWLSRQGDETMRLFGYILAVVGVVDTFVIPLLLARAWSSKRR